MAPLFHRSTRDAAFERLYQRHVTDVYRYSLAVLGEAADAEDVTQTTFLNAYRAFKKGERPSKPQNWLITIAHNVCRQRFRQAQRRPAEVEFVDAISEAPLDEASGPRADDVRRAFSQLRPSQREALVLRELEGRSYAEIAAILGISASALETLLFRARRALREQLEEQLTCDEAAFAISKEEDGRLSSAERGALRAHLRSCPECATAAKRQRALRGAFKGILAVPLPASLGSFSGWGATGLTASGAGIGGAGIALKAAAVLAAGAAVGGGTYVGVEHARPQHPRPAPVSHVAPPAPAKGSVASVLTSHGALANPVAHLKRAKPSQHAPKDAHGSKGRSRAKPAARHSRQHKVKALHGNAPPLAQRGKSAVKKAQRPHVKAAGRKR
jgi:RNA polymerase sigma factor (sigma-70 family)